MARPTVVIELAGDAQFARDLAVGGVFVPGCTLRLTEECELVVCGANHQISLPARVVYVEQQRGAGLELIGFSSEIKARLAELEPVTPGELVVVDEPVIDHSTPDGSNAQIRLAMLMEYDGALNGPVESIPLIDIEALEAASAVIEDRPFDPGELYNDDDLALPIADDHRARMAFYRAGATYPTSLPDFDTLPPDNAVGREPADAPGAGAMDDGAVYGDRAGDERAYDHASQTSYDARGDAGDEARDDGGDDADDGTGEPRAGKGRFARNVHERLRGLTLVAQIKLAGSGELHERIVLERLYGKNVWETLLRNPRLTAPEVARIARYGSLPRVLLEIIVANNTWLQIPEVRRALLAHPRLANDQIIKVLRLTPKHELKLAAIQTAYPLAVRNLAKAMMRSE